MAFLLSGFNVMEHLWDTLEKTQGGNHIRYTSLDIEQLWFMGFVDTAHFSLGQWRAVFDPYLEQGGTYLLGREAFYALDEYRYKGEIKIPFDAMKINEGLYSNEGLNELFEMSVFPSTSLSRDKLDKFLGGLKKEFRQADGLILIKKPAKEKIKKLLMESPSPLRNLEIMLEIMIQESGAEMLSDIEKHEADYATVETARQISNFSSKPTTKSEVKSRELKELVKAKEKAHTEDKTKPKVELKKIRRSRKGMRG